MANILFFGDQTAEQLHLLRKLFLHTKNARLVAFLEQAGAVIREETGRLPLHQRQQIPSFLTINTLVNLYSESPARSTILESTLVTIAQLGHYIG